MECALLRRKYGVTQTAATVDIVGSADESLGFVEYGGKRYSNNGDRFIAFSEDTMTFAVKGYTEQLNGYVDINGARVLKVTKNEQKEYMWTIPGNVRTITVNIVVPTTRTCYMVVTTR